MFWYTHEAVLLPGGPVVSGLVTGPRVLFRKTAKGLTDREGRRWRMDPSERRAYRSEGKGYVVAVGLVPVEGWTHKGIVREGLPGGPGARLRNVWFTPQKGKFLDSQGVFWRVARQGGSPCQWNSSAGRYEHLAEVVLMKPEGEQIEVDAGDHIEFPLGKKTEDLEDYNNGTLRDRFIMGVDFSSPGEGRGPCA